MLYGGVVAWIRRVRTASGATAVQVVESVRGRGEHPSVGDDHQVVQAVPGLEGLDDRHDRVLLGRVALPAADLERESAPVDQICGSTRRSSE